MASAVISFYSVFQLELKSYFLTSCRAGFPGSVLPHLFGKGLSALLFFFDPGYDLMLFIGQIFAINLVSNSVFEFLPLICKWGATALS